MTLETTRGPHKLCDFCNVEFRGHVWEYNIYDQTKSLFTVFFKVYLLNEAEYDMKNYAYQGRCSASVTLQDPHSSQYTKAEFGSYFMIHPKISKFQTSLPPCRLSSK